MYSLRNLYNQSASTTALYVDAWMLRPDRIIRYNTVWGISKMSFWRNRRPSLMGSGIPPTPPPRPSWNIWRQSGLLTGLKWSDQLQHKLLSLLLLFFYNMDRCSLDFSSPLSALMPFFFFLHSTIWFIYSLCTQRTPAQVQTYRSTAGRWGRGEGSYPGKAVRCVRQACANLSECVSELDGLFLGW